MLNTATRLGRLEQMLSRANTWTRYDCPQVRLVSVQPGPVLAHLDISPSALMADTA